MGRVYAGLHDRADLDEVESRDISRMIFHSEYLSNEEEGTDFHDIAILKVGFLLKMLWSLLCVFLIMAEMKLILPDHF